MSSSLTEFNRLPVHVALARRAALEPDRRWVRFVDGAEITYAQAWDSARRTGGGLRRLGAARGDRVVLFMENHADFLATWFGALDSGLIAVPLNTTAKGAILEHYLRITAPAVVVVDAELTARLARALDVVGIRPHVVVVGAGAAEAGGHDVTAFDDLSAPPSTADAEPVGRLDHAAIIFTSGTTGASKGVTFSHRFLTYFADQGVQTFGYAPDDVSYTCLPFFHANALVLVTCASLLVGNQVVVARRFSVRRFWSDAVASGATVTSLLGSMASLLLKQEPSPVEREHQITRAMLVPGPAEYYALLDERFGITPIDMYGLTDAGIAISARWGHEVKAGSCGRVMDGFEAKLVDQDGDEVPTGTAGLLLIRPSRSGVMSDGYWKMPERTVEAWRGLWFHTGDVLRRDQEGWYYFVDRQKDAIRRRGENVSSHEVEQAFLSHPDVLEAAAYPIKSPLTEDDVALAVVGAPGVNLDPEELVRFAEDRLPYYCLPRYVTVLNELPKTPTLKVQKATLVHWGVTARTWDMESSAFRPTR